MRLFAAPLIIVSPQDNHTMRTAGPPQRIGFK